MPTQVGPNTFGEENLAFGYDLGDTVNSYIGEPTVNLIDSINFTTDYNTSWNAQENIIQTKNQVNPKGVVDVTAIKIESNSVTDNFFGVRGVKFASSRTNHTFSFWAKGNKAYNNFPIYFGVAQVLATVNITTEWKFFAVQTGAGVTFADHTLHLGGWGSWTDNTFDLFLWHPQLEQKPYPTPFTTGTRSVTQGLIDLTGNSTINLSNVSFDSNSQMIFDGTDDLITLSDADHLRFANGSFTVEQIVKINFISGKQRLFSKGSSGWTRGWHTAARSSQWELELSDGISSPGNSFLINYSTTVGTNHVVWVIESAATAKLYVNGVQAGSTQIITERVDFATTTSAAGIGAFESGGEYLNGSIPYTRLYNRALTAAEVASNFRAVKSRFNI